MFIDDHISSIISNIDRTLIVAERVGDLNLKFCDNKWIKLFNYIIGDGVGILHIKVINPDGSITFDEDVSLVTTFELPNVVFFVGSRMQTSSEWIMYSNVYEEKVPFIWLNFPANITKTTRGIDSLVPWFENWSDIRLFFVGDMDRSQWLAQETITERTKVLDAWARGFVNAIQYPYEYDDVQYYFHPIFGTENEKGAIQDIIEGNLSAISIDFNLKVLQDFNCKNC